MTLKRAVEHKGIIQNALKTTNAARHFDGVTEHHGESERRLGVPPALPLHDISSNHLLMDLKIGWSIRFGEAPEKPL